MTKLQVSFEQALPFVLADIKEGMTPALLGKPGIGKSSFVENLARELKTRVFSLAVNQLADKADLTGARMTQSEEGKWRQEMFPHFIIAEAVEYAEEHPDETPILFLDEFNRTTTDITSAVLSLQTERRIGATVFPDNLRVVVAGNDDGNITPVDDASTSRFSVYHMKPDINTFLKLQNYNPFVRKVLEKYPETLIAPQNADLFTANTEDDADEDSDELSVEDLAGIMGGDGGSFKQITCPRTITYANKWLNRIGITASGTDEEKNLLGSFLNDTVDNSETTTLLVALIAHTGETKFTYHLYEEIVAYHHNQISSPTAQAGPSLNHLRPDQDVINKLSRAGSVDEVQEIVDDMTEEEVTSALVWLFAQENVTEINNTRVTKEFIHIGLNKATVESFNDTDIAQNIMSVLPNTSIHSKSTIEAFIESDAPSIQAWIALLKAFN